MSNSEMVAGRFLRWADARRKLAWVHARWAEGYTVVLTTHLRAWSLKPKHADYLKATRHGLYMRSGNSWTCADYCAMRATKGA